MALSIFCALLTLLATLTCASTNGRQAGRHDALGRETKIAIVGAGLSGASTAYHLREKAPPDQPLSITIFDSSERIGGRVASFPVPDTQNRTILETGAASFFTDDECITQSVEKLDLALVDKETCWSLLGCLHSPLRRTGIWNGKEIIGKALLALGLSEWLDKHGLLWIVKPVVWSNNMSVWDTLRLLHWNDLKLDPGLQASCDFTSPSIWRRIHMRYEYGSSPALFRRAVHTTTERFQHFGRTDRFSEVGEELRRVGLHGDIAKLSAADYLTGLGTTELFQIEVIEPCVRARSSLDLTQLGSLSKNLLSPLSYTSTHVTYFATEHAFKSKYLNLAVDADIPDRLLTTSAESNLMSLTKWDGMGFYWEDRFWRKRPWMTPSKPEDYECANGRFHYENLYRVMTRRHVSDRGLAAMIGKSWEDGQNATDVGFSWVHRQEWNKSVPKFGNERDISEDIEVMEGLFWLGGSDEVMSSLEMSCKMGRNVASKIIHAQDRETSRRAHGELYLR
ncbi:hypothetical protein J4E85_002804 [Alternaria conjuncta]|uniref:uncharacterized protein n=1 Tax=Alternaria conjuncta TaxID=181017 RepID=UPI00221E8D7F|nr:uncharacterized protein J4E85_002804 [Alternaria conjuncta]KAI4934942.1 hypothetical protein J4E85_002804 [Alternaria conjuncta]